MIKFLEQEVFSWDLENHNILNENRNLPVIFSKKRQDSYMIDKTNKIF